VFNFPKPLQVDDYERVRQKAIDYYSGKVISLYERGTVRHPGISDIDLMVVVDGRIEQIDHDIDTSLLVFPRKHFEHINVWDDDNPKLLWGENIGILPEHRPEVGIARIVDWLPERIVRLSEMKEINVSWALAVIKGVCYSLQKLKEYGVDNNYCSQVWELRDEWFNLPRTKQERGIAHLVSGGIEAGINGLRVFSDVACDYYGDSDINGELLIPLNTKYIFNGKLKAEGSTIQLPRFFGKHFHTYAKESGLISREIARHMSGNYSPPGRMEGVLGERISLCNHWAEFLIQHEMSGLYKFGWYYTELHGYRRGRSANII